MLKSLMALCLIFAVQANANVKADEAEAAYALRDFNEMGIKNVNEAIKLFDEAITLEADTFQKKVLTHRKSEAFYFLGTALDKKKERMAAHQEAMDISDVLMTGFGVDAEKAHELSDTQIADLLNTLNDDEELLLAEVFYAKGINLGQWGQLNGIASSIGRLPIVLGLMDRIEKLGHEDINYYGPVRTVGRANFVLPKIFGGDLDKSETLLKRAYKETLVPGKKYSVNGYNNLYLAETMYKRGKETQAIKLLETFVAADPSTLAEGNEPENKEALRTAQERLDDWK